MLVFCIAVGIQSASAVEAPRVEFDVSPVVSCQDVTTPDDIEARPDEVVLEATYRVSIRLIAGEERDLEELVFEITNPERRLRVVDFSPSTQLESRLAGEVEVTSTSEKLSSLGVSLGGQVAVPVAGVEVKAAPSANIGTTRRNVVTETRKKIPPKELVVASGTIEQSAGVFFKLKPSLDGSFEGQKEFVCRYAAPIGWRGDWTLVRCAAQGRVKHLLSTSVETCGSEKAYVGLYRNGDLAAKLAARQLAAAQQYARQLRARPAKPSLLPWLDSGPSPTEQRANTNKSISAARRALGRMGSEWEAN
jgi:hypothetical protein